MYFFKNLSTISTEASTATTICVMLSKNYYYSINILSKCFQISNLDDTKDIFSC